MSRIQRPSNANQSTITQEAIGELPSVTSLTAPAPTDGQKESYTTRVVFEANASALQMQEGVVVQLANASHVFAAAAEDVDVSKGILTSITVKSIYSDCSEPVTFALNLYNSSEQEPNIKNNEGWLHTPTQTDFGSMASSRDDEGYRNLLAVMPYEKSRSELNVYEPNEIATDRYIQQYGNYSGENLHDGVVAFPGEQYYLVSQNHVVLDVIRQNWEQLGINVDNEARFNGKYVQVPAHVFDRVINDLQSHVLARMPFTNLNDVRAKFYSKPTEHYADAHPDGADGLYKVCVELQMNYQFPSPAAEKSLQEDVA
jgi:hypothetical protein|tara:strand:+ start:2458 stop:3399 length:942 start_codon:yes stop_codon:yes gene_type:complete